VTFSLQGKVTEMIRWGGYW